ncbi:MAG: flagellar export chaperone FliS [Capsulimonadaceae bacterium]|nr:flagellar export chaperone FliS [Capsulimonadaceae bacterium]
MSLPNPYAQYRQTQAVTASQMKLIIMLHDGAIRALQQAATATEARDLEKMASHYNKATEIISHLSSSVRPDTGEIAQNLGQIYIYCLQRILYANAMEDASIAREIIGHIRSIRDAWEQVERMKAASTPQDKSSTDKMDLSFAA